ncbi:hypothetical protein TMatcc_001420 [Talaromyces marneffei ATCC 18224]|uniref:DUF7703 domain-containing protein n=2 Tax=Talaromyces marneffei TaxID=37727 RepID=B6QK39_TALMQ|nr:uncharacterized protein EYB26_007349 [Talaromyces marneffei]EEA22571.1 conserved hypothetical protein [Talaromyces marneffei ATCC 18224]KAE8551467.1 hypothetical protein EYB25_005357 [Talaromyces marneffei]QGA19660.1 hypothetical protein EYB26_007349 [Talaromyces marneffei]
MPGDNDANDIRAPDGISGFFNTDNTLLAIFLIFFMLLSIYNALELVIMIFVSFRRFRGLYFWSLLLSALLGLIPYSIGFFLKFFTHVSPWITCTVLTVGWWTMVTGQAIVLYSRLHLVLRDPTRLKQVLCMICINAVVLHLPTTILTYGSNNPNSSPKFIVGYNIMEKIQLTGFSIQEAIISGLYLYETYKLLHLTHRNRAQRWIQYQLIAVNVLIILMDLTLLVLEYASEYAIQICLKGAVYSIKLKLEFAVLGQLVDFIRNKNGNYHHHDDDPTNGTGIDMGDRNMLSSSKRRYAGQDAGLPSTRADDPHFYGKTTTTVHPNEIMNSSEERLNLPSGIIMAKTEFVQRVDHKRDNSDDLE